MLLLIYIICLAQFNSYHSKLTTRQSTFGDKFLSVNCKRVIDSASNRYVYANVDIDPEFPGGKSAGQRFLNKQMKIKEEWLEDQAFKSYATVSFIVETDGSLSNLYVIKEKYQKENTPFENYFLTLLTSMPNWKPGICNGKPVPIRTQQSIVICISTE